jgi:rhodanese-related sulfurtransferase
MIEVKRKTITPLALSAILGTEDKLELLDVRTPPEYASAHVPGARLVPLSELEVEDFLTRHQPGTPLYVLCHSGARAGNAIEQLERAGCGDCVLVEGGTQGWIDAGLPVHGEDAAGARKVLPIMRQVQIVVGSLAATGAILALAVNPWFAVVPLFLGCGLLFAGVTGTCGMALMLARMPWNRMPSNQGQDRCSHGCSGE